MSARLQWRGKDFLDLHRALVDLGEEERGEWVQGKYYWEIRSEASLPAGSYFELTCGRNKRVICGDLNALPINFVAVCVDNILRVYANQLMKLAEKACDCSTVT